MVLFYNKEDTPFSSRMNHKSIREKERRDEINNKINELRNYVCDDEIDKKANGLKQADVLWRTVELVYRLEGETPGTSYQPERKGFIDAFGFVENEVLHFIRNLGVDPSICQDFIDRVKACFEQEKQQLLLSKGSPGLKKKGSPVGRVKSSPDSDRSTPSPFKKLDRKIIKKNREQDRRDRQGEAIEALKHFLIVISANRSKIHVEKMQRLTVLENILEYIKSKKGNFTTDCTQEKTLYQVAYNGGFEIATKLALEFFKNDKHLCVRTAALERHIKFQRALQLHNTQPTPVPSAVSVGFPPMPFGFLPVIPNFCVSSPTYSVESGAPSPSDTSSSSIESTPTIWRPWV
ncbi:unnamed protein product [Caenorhabditis bovis]|uniref:BHLH domain-containing protein n=1 Tax=Caenorhabditis bovis TaxID=2654633 RepID=A0A8S1FB85_9PELO|nr:unnamed protein product [Caenorhabditis bovis]